MASRTKTAAIEAYNERKQLLEHEAHRRTVCIINTIIGDGRKFPGQISIDNSGKPKAKRDADHLQEFASLYENGKALALWTDGSLSQAAKDYDDVLGAGVAWQEKDRQGRWEWKTSMYSLGVHTGSGADAELFGITAALHLAAEKAEKDKGVVHVRILSDCVRVMQATMSGKGKGLVLRPAATSPWALQQIYDYADILVGMGVEVELAWVKGHAQSGGNNHADRVAREVVRMQKGSKENARFLKKKEVPERIAAMGTDSVEEWYWRVNKERLLRGDEEEDEDEDDGDGSWDMEILRRRLHIIGWRPSGRYGETLAYWTRHRKSPRRGVESETPSRKWTRDVSEISTPSWWGRTNVTQTPTSHLLHATIAPTHRM
jgi:ribonuclease HI